MFELKTVDEDSNEKHLVSLWMTRFETIERCYYTQIYGLNLLTNVVDLHVLLKMFYNLKKEIFMFAPV